MSRTRIPVYVKREFMAARNSPALKALSPPRDYQNPEEMGTIISRRWDSAAMGGKGSASARMKGIAVAVPVLVLAFAMFSPTVAPVRETGAAPGGPEADFVTGGGGIWHNGHHLNFGFNAGYKPSQPLGGQLNYVDHGGQMHLKAESVDNYLGTGNSRT